MIGSAVGCDLVLDGDGIAPRHCRLHRHGESVRLDVLDATANTAVNGRMVARDATLQSGDVLLIGSLACVVAYSPYQSTVRTRPLAEPGRGRAARLPADPTQVRSVLPRLVLRGLSGPTLGRGFPVRDGMLFGRNRGSDVFIESQQISRSHARLQVSGSTIRIEDLGSTNGTFVNGKQVESAMLLPGDEIALDNVKFVLIEPGVDTARAVATANASRRNWWWLLVVALALAGLLLGWLWL